MIFPRHQVIRLNLLSVLLSSLFVGTAATAAEQVIEEVIVTAERREESLQDVSVSVTALNEEALRLAGIDDVSRLELVVPGVNYAFAGNDAKFNVRGANSTNTYLDNSSIVGAFVDGIYQARASQQTRAFFDVAAVEFLRGPQGTLYGRNTFAGALNVYTHEPHFDGFGGGVEVSKMSYDRVRTEGHANLPFWDTLSVRIAGYSDQGGGYIHNDAGPNLGAQNDIGYRISALWTPSDRVEFLARYTDVQERGYEAGLFGYTFVCRNETREGLTDPFGELRNCRNPVRGSEGYGAASNGPGGDAWRISHDYVRPVDLHDDTFSLTTTIDFNIFTMKWITANNDFSNNINFDFDYGPSPNQAGGQLESSKGFSHELQLTSVGDGQLQWTAGVYYSELEDFYSFYIYQQTRRFDGSRPRVTVDGAEHVLLHPTYLVSRNVDLNGFWSNAGLINTDYVGAYTQGEFSVSDSFRLILGIRYNNESKQASCGGDNFTGDLNEDGKTERVVNLREGISGANTHVLPKSANSFFTYDCSAPDALTSETIDGSSGEFDNITWRAGVEFDVNEDIMLYLTGSTGYLSGSASTSTITDEQTSQVIEAGFRSVLLNQTMQLNGALHITQYTNLLTQRQTLTNIGTTNTFSDNGGDIEALGFELDMVWLPTDKITTTLTLAFLDSTFGTFGQQNPYQLYDGEVQSFVDQNGETPGWSPTLTLGLSAGYRFDFRDNGTFTPYIQMYYSDEYNTSNLLSTDPAHHQDAFTKVDIRLIWESADLRYTIEAFGENIGDVAVLARGNNNSDDIVQTSYLYPKNLGIKVRANF